MQLRRSTVKMEAISTPETSVIRKLTWFHNRSHMRMKSATNSSYHFVAYLSTSAQITTCPTLWSVNNEMKRVMKEGAVIWLWYCHAEIVEKQKK